MSNYLVFFCLLALTLSSIVGPSSDSSPVVSVDPSLVDSAATKNQNPPTTNQGQLTPKQTQVNSEQSALPSEQSQAAKAEVANVPQSTVSQTIQNEKVSTPITMIKSLLSKKYLQELAQSNGTQKNSSVPAAMAEYQKELIKKYKIGNEQSKTGTSNVDNGKNNTFIGKDNVVIKGGSNSIIGVSNAINGSGNHIVDGKNNIVQGDNNVIMSGPVNLEKFNFPLFSQTAQQNLGKQGDSSVGTLVSEQSKTKQQVNKTNCGNPTAVTANTDQVQTENKKENSNQALKQNSSHAKTSVQVKNQTKSAQKSDKSATVSVKTNNLQVTLEPLTPQSAKSATPSISSSSTVTVSTVPSSKTSNSNSQTMTKLVIAILLLAFLLS